MSSTREFVLEMLSRNKSIENTSYSGMSHLEKNGRKSLLDTFKDNLALASGTWYELANVSGVLPLIKAIHPNAHNICSATEEVRGNKDLNRVTTPNPMKDVDVAIIRAEFGVAETGMVWVSEENMQINALGPLTQHLVILLDPDRMVKNMHEAYEEVYLSNHNYGCFMLGPSATAEVGTKTEQATPGPRSLTVCFC